MSPAWPTRDDFRRMTPAEVNRFFESIGSSWRVADPDPGRTAAPAERLAGQAESKGDSSAFTEMLEADAERDKALVEEWDATLPEVPA